MFRIWICFFRVITYVYCTVDGQDSDPHQLEKSDPDPLPKMERIRNTGGNMIRSILRLLRLLILRLLILRLLRLLILRLININIVMIQKIIRIIKIMIVKFF